MSRPAYHKPSGERGKAGEKYFNHILGKLAVKKNWDYIWHNKEGNESYKKYDFTILRNGEIIALVECETKYVEYEKYFIPDGLDFIAEKVEYLARQQKRLNRPCYYCMIMSDRSNILYLTGNQIIERGEKLVKDNRRSKGECFYRVPYDMCLKVSPITREIDRTSKYF